MAGAAGQVGGKSMVAVIAGNGLGLDNSSLRQLGQGPSGQAAIGQNGVDQYLNAATGNLILQNADEGLIFDGLPLAALRTYNSQGQLTGSQGWLLGFSRSIGGLTETLDTAGSTVVRTGDDGSTVTYVYDATRGLYVSNGQSGAEDTLSWSVASSTWTWMYSANSQQETYDASGRLTGLSDLQTGAHYSFNYNGGQLSQIVADDGDTLIFGYDGAGQLSSLSVQEIPPGQGTAVTRQQVGYAYDVQGRLSTVTTTLGSDTDTSTDSYVTTYTYDGTSDRIASVSQSDGTVVSYTYAADTNGVYRVTTITTGAAAQTLTLSYDLATDTTTVTNALGQAWTYTYNAAGQLTQVAAPTFNGSSPTTRYNYDSNGNLLTVTDADGGITSYSYDARGNRLSVEDATGHTVSYTYNADDQVLSQTVYTVPAQGVVGESGYVAPDGAQTTYYVYDANDRLSYVVDPLGHVTEHDYTTTGGLTVLSSTQHYAGVAYSLTGLSPSTPPSLSQLQNWVASATVQATLADALRTDYSYDVRGQLTKQTQWDTLGINGVGTLAGDAGATVTTYTYDAQGRLLQTSAMRDADRTTLETTSYAYDGLDRLVSRTDPLGRVTSYVYTDSNNVLAITQANGLTATQVRNGAGLLLSSTSSASGETGRLTTYLYNAAGQAVATIDPAGNVSYTFYDADDRVAGTVDALGSVTAYTRDADGHAIGTTQYAIAIDTSDWVSGGALTASLPATLPVPAASADDRTSHVIVDAAGREIATIDAAGAVTTTTYDGEGNAISHTAYATALTPAQLAVLGGAPTWAALQTVLSSASGDRTTVTVYDTAGRVAATIDAAGYVSTLTYDAAGRVSLTRGYALALTATQRTALGDAPTLADLQADLTAGAGDQTTRTYYDGEGRAVAQVDAEGYLTTTAYDETAHITTTVRYGTALTSSQLAALTGSESVAALVGLLGGNTASQQSRTTYNADGQVTTATAVDGTVTTNSYNLVGQLLSTTVTPAAGQGVAHTSSATYDAFGDTLTRVDGNHATTTYTYNVLGQRLTAADALGNITYTYYDADGRVAYTVQGQLSGATRNALGNVTAYAYNAFGQVASTRHYASQLTLTSGSSSGTTLNPVTATLAQVAAAVAALPVSASDADGLTTYSYTLDGQLANATDGAGYQTAYAYDAFGDRTQVQQQLSAPGSALSAANSTLNTFAYDARGEQTGETEAVGTAVARSTSQTYDAFGRVTSVTDGDGHVVTYSYDNLGRQVSTSQTVGSVVLAAQTTYDAFNRVVTQTDPLGNVTAYQYDVASHRTIVTTLDGVTMTTVKDAFGDTVSVTDGAGDTTTYTYNADGQWLTRTDALGNTSTNQYDADGELIQSTDASGHVVTASYDASGRVLTRTVDPSGLALKTTYSYDGEGRELSVTDPAGVVTTYTYDADGQVLTQVQDAGTGKLNLTTTYTHDGAGKTLTVTAGAGTAAARTTQYVYDNLERLSQQIVDPGTGHLNLTTTYAYDANDNLISVTDANGHATRSVYDEANEKIFAIDAAGAVTQVTVDTDGRVTAVHAYATALTAAQLTALGATPTVAAVAADVVASASDTVSYTAYNAEGQVRYTVDPMGYVTETRYDAAGRVSETLGYAHAVSVTPGDATLLQTLQATALSSLGTLVSGAGNTDANAEVTLQLYDADGQVRFVVQQNTVNGQRVGVVSEQRYDAAGRVIARIAYGSTLTLSTTSALTAQLTTSSVTQSLASAPRQISQSVYDNAGRLRYSIDTTNHVTETQVDTDGRVTAQLAYANAITVPGTLTVATVGAAVAAAGTAGARISSTTYDAAGRVLTTGDALGVNATFTYDATGLQTGHADRDGHWTVDLYDTAGRKTLEQSPPVNVGSWAAGTGAFQQGVAYLYTTYAYDGVGNVTSISRGTGPDSSHVTVLSTTTYAYDAIGHQIQTTYPGGVSTHVVYDALGHAVTDQDGNGHWQYKVYNADGKVAYAVDADGYVTGTRYDAYDNVTAITRYATALNTAAITGWSASQPLTMAQLQQGLATSVSDRTITTTYDQLNRKVQVQQPTIAIVLTVGPLAGNGATGTPTTTYTYDVYGNTTSVSTLIQPALTAGTATTPAVWATTYTYYDALNRAVMMVTPTGAYTSPQGYVTTTSYDAFGEVASSTQFATAIATSGLTTGTPPAAPTANAYDRTTTYSYDAIGRKASETDAGEYSYVNGTPALAAGSSVITLAYDGENRVTSLTVNGLTTTTVYDALGRVSSVTAPARQALVSNWQTLLQSTPGDDLASAALYTTVSPLTYVIYDALGNILNTTVQAGSLAQQTWVWYDARGNQIQVADAGGNYHDSTYDNNGNVISQSSTLTSNSGSSTVTSTYTYDADNQQLTTAVQRSGQGGYDSYTQVQYNAFGEVVAKGDNSGVEAHYTYNNAGQLSTAPDSKTGATHTYGYDLAGHAGVDGVYVAGGSQQTWIVDTLDLGGRIVSRILPSDAAATGGSSTALQYTYDRWGNLSSSTDAAGNTTQYHYDSQNQLAQEIEPNVLVVSATGIRTWTTPSKEWYYNVSGQLIGMTDENGNSSWNTYDGAGHLTIAQDATGAKTYTAYDVLGRAVAQQTPPANTATGPVARITYTSYNALDQIIEQGDFLIDSAGTGRTRQAQQTYALNSNGDRIQVTDALGNASFYDYDSQHRVITSQTPLQYASGWSETFTYDANGHKTDDTTANGDHQSWVVDYFGRVQSHVDLSGALTTYTYDASSALLTSETSNWAPAGQTNPGYLTTTLIGVGSSEQYQYYADGQVAQVTQMTGGNIAGWNSYQYDANGNQAVDATYTVDGAGQVVRTETVAIYDSHNRLGVETTENPDNSVANSRVVYNYDAAGNRRAVFAQSAYGLTATPISGNGGAPTGAVVAQTAQPGQAWNLSVGGNFVDNVGFGLTFTATQSNGTALPGWMSFNSNGNFTGTPTTGGSWAITVTATDINGQSVGSTFTVTVPVVAPVFTAGASNQTGSVHGALNFTVPGATDANGSGLTYTASYYNGSSWVALPSWLSFNASTLAFAGTPPVGSIGSYSLCVTATAANGGSTAEAFTLTVAPTAPVYVGGVGSQTTYGGRAFSFAFAASDFSEADGDALTFSAGSYVMNSGIESDSALPSWMSFNASTLTFTGTPPTSVVGQSFNLYLMAKNPQGQAAEAHFTVTVQQYVQPAPVYNGGLTNGTGVIGGASLSLSLPANAFSESDGGALTYSAMVLIPEHVVQDINSKGMPVARTVAAAWVAISQVGLSINATSGAITGVPTALKYLESSDDGTYYQDSSYAIQVTATNGQGGAAAAQFTLSNTYAPPAVAQGIASPSAMNPNAGTLAIVPANAFADPYDQGLVYSAMLSNGAALPAGLSWSGISLTVGQLASGSYAIKVTATDGLGHTGSTTFTLTINNIAPVWSGSMPNMSVAQSQALTAFQLPTATDGNGDSISYSATGLPPGVSFNASTRTFSGTPTTAGIYTITYTATDGRGGSVSGAFQISVTNAPPPIYNGGIPASITFALSTSSTYLVPASAFSSPEGYALTYSSNANTTGWLGFSPSTRTFSALLDDNDYGPATITITATDSLGHTASTSFIAYGQHIRNPKLLGDAVVTSPDSGMQPQLVPIDGGGGGGSGGGSGGSGTPPPVLTPNIQSYWFTYDADNRVVISDGALVNNAVMLTNAATSYTLGYDAAGNATMRTTIDATTGATMAQASYYDVRNELVRADYAVNLANGTSRGIEEMRQYDAAGHQTSSEQFYALGTTVSGNTAIYHKLDPDQLANIDDSGTDVSGMLASATVDHYDVSGRVEQEQNFGHIYSWDGTGGTSTVPGSAPAEGATAWGGMLMLNQVTYKNASGGSGYDAAGNVVAYHYDAGASSGNRTDSYTVTYLKKDGYLEQATSGSSTNSNYRPATDNSDYDSLGRRIAIVQHVTLADSTLADTMRAFAYDAAGQIVQRRDGTASGSTFQATSGAGTKHFSYVNGQQVGAMDEGGGIHVLDGLTAFSNTNVGTSGYVVQTGDTLKSIAQAEYGNASLWYVIAQANALSSDNDLVAGQMLTIPQVTTHQNSATTFQPYNASRISGSTTPTLPFIAPPPPSSNGCNALAAIVIIAVAVVVSVVTYGALSGEMAGWAAGAIAGASASAASQLAGDALGVQHGFSWGQVLVDAVGGAVGGGLGQAFSKGGTFAATFASDAGNGINTAGNAIIGAASYAGTYEADKLTGQVSHFSWVGLVANAAGSAAGGEFGPNNAQATAGQQGHFSWNRIGANIVQDVTTRETSEALGDNHVQSWQQVGEDVFGNALGNTAIAGINAYEANSAQKRASFNSQAQSEWGQDQEQFNMWSAGSGEQDGSSVMQGINAYQANQLPPTLQGNSNYTLTWAPAPTSNDDTSAGQDQGSMEWRAPDYAPPPLGTTIIDLGAVTVGSDGTGSTVTAYPSTNGALPAPSEGSTPEEELYARQVDVNNAAMAQANQQLLTNFNAWQQADAKKFVMFNVDIAITGGSFGAASVLGLTGLTLSGASAGGIGGYISGGWHEVPNGIAFGALASPLLGYASTSIAAVGVAGEWGGGTKVASQILTAVVGDSGIAAGSTMASNYLSNQPLLGGVLKSALIGAAAPILSAEVVLLAAGETGPAAVLFNAYSGLLNSAMIAADVHSQSGSQSGKGG